MKYKCLIYKYKLKTWKFIKNKLKNNLKTINLNKNIINCINLTKI